MIARIDPDAWKNIPGWTCRRLREWYSQVAREIPGGGTFVEIGVAYGASLAYLITQLAERELVDDDGWRGMQPVRTVGVDIWQDHQGKGQLDDETWNRVTGHGDPFRACVAELARSASYVFGRTTLVRDTGANAANLFGPDTVDCVFIDEHHTFESVSEAIKAWLPKVKRGGWLSGHDCNPHYPGVMQAVSACLPGEVDVREPHPFDGGWGGVWVWKKP